MCDTHSSVVQKVLWDKTTHVSDPQYVLQLDSTLDSTLDRGYL